MFIAVHRRLAPLDIKACRLFTILVVAARHGRHGPKLSTSDSPGEKLENRVDVF